jgi:hypothetical protein
MKKLLASIIVVLAISSCTNLQTIGGYEEESDDYDGYNLRPMVLSAWYVTSKEDKHNRFVNSLKYFYEKYTDKRDYIESFFDKNENWFRWDDV